LFADSLRVEPVHAALKQGELSEDADYAWKMAMRRWSRDAHKLAATLDKVVTVARDHDLLSHDVARRYTMSCTSTRIYTRNIGLYNSRRICCEA